MNGTPLVVGIGEALFDCFPDGRRVLGGAPLNVAFHANQLLKSFGGSGIVFSRVGNDSDGHDIIDRVSGWSPSSILQVDSVHPTGTVIASPRDDSVDYDIREGVAWDFLAWSPELGTLASRCGAVTFGSLAQRSEVSRETIRGFLAISSRAIRLFDVNLRQDYFSREIIEPSCSLATLVKCNEDELPLIHRMFFGDSSASPEAMAGELRSRFHLDAWVLTRGKRGTMAATRSGVSDADPVSYPPEANADPVGAGDACAAAILSGLLTGKPWETILSLANRVGAWVASRAGATPELPDRIGLH